MNRLHHYLGLKKPKAEKHLTLRSFEEEDSLPDIVHEKAEELWKRASKRFSVEISNQNERVGICIIRIAPDNLAEIVHLEGKNEQSVCSAVRAALGKLWEAEYLRVICDHERYFPALKRVGFENVTKETSPAWFCQVQALANQGRFDEAVGLYQGEVPENVEFLLSWRSKNELYWLELENWTPTEEGQGTPLTRRGILAAAPLAFHAFGDLKWLEDFLSRSLVGVSVGVLGKDYVEAACFVGRSNSYPCIASICVQPKLRQKGLATSLLSHSLRLLKQSGERVVVAHVRESNQASRALFEKSGFKKIGKLDDLLEFGKAAGYLRREKTAYLPAFGVHDIDEACAQAHLKLLP